MITTAELHWAAGFLEGEGAFLPSSCRVMANQVQREPLERLERLFGGRIVLNKKRGRSLPINIWYLGSHAGAAVMMTLYTLMSPRRRDQIAKALTHWRRVKVNERYRLACPRGHAYSVVTKLGKRRCRECHISGGYLYERKKQMVEKRG